MSRDPMTATLRPMPRRTASYPVLFAEPGEAPYAGSLRFLHDGLVLSGGADGNLREARVAIADIVAVRTSRTIKERLGGLPVVVIERAGGEPLVVAPIGAGLLAELADLLVSLTSEGSRGERVAIELPLKPKRLERARELIERGPPFDPRSLAGTAHTVYLDDARVLFVFEGRDARRTVERLMRSPALWGASLAWRECSAGRPQAVDLESLPTGQPIFRWPAE
jgi:hypothetical protein